MTASGHTVVEAAGRGVRDGPGVRDVTATDACSVRALANARVHVSGSARAWAWGNAVARARDTAAVSAWGSASVLATDSAEVEARENAFVAAGGSAAVRAFGAAMVRARGNARSRRRGRGQRHPPFAGAVVHGGAGHGRDPLHDPAEWCAYYGVEVDDGVAILYKAVDEEFSSYHGGSYRPGTEPTRRRLGRRRAGMRRRACICPRGRRSRSPTPMT